MYISQQLKQQNIAEYLLYMWQIEDLLRAYHFDMDRIKKDIVDPYPVSEEQKTTLFQWYKDLANMMHDEGVMEKGHVQINKNIIVWLTDLHLQLLRSPKYPYYSAAYYKALPFIVELRAKGADKDVPELETCFDAMYGVLMLKLQKKEISEETQKAIKVISDLLAILADYYIKELDICNEQAVMNYAMSNNIDIIVNCAAYTAVDKAEDNVELCKMLNQQAPGFLAKAAKARNGYLIQVSTDYVFDGTAHIPYREDEETCPNSVYGVTKLGGEQEAFKYCPETMVIRTAWLYSSFGNNFVKTMMRLGRERDTLGVIFDQIGTPTYARDLAVAIFAAINKGIVPGVYHFSNEGVCSWYDFTKAIHAIAGIQGCNVKPLHTEDYPTKATRPHYSVLDKTKIKETYGIEIPYWMDSLKECMEILMK